MTAKGSRIISFLLVAVGSQILVNHFDYAITNKGTAPPPSKVGLDLTLVGIIFIGLVETW